jgi:drug/metabolite transporter (DMT)-like permease
VTVLFALLTAFSNALNVVTQHIASINSPKRATGLRFVVYLFKSPLWLFGWVALAGSFVFQALALHNGQLSVVQPLLVTELVFALLLRRFWVRQSLRSVTWWSAVATCVTLGIFLAMSQPQGGHEAPTTDAWLSAALASFGLTGVLALLAQWGSPSRRAAMYASATAILWALVAVFIKTTTNTFTEFGAGGMFTHWPVYALAACGLAAEILNQATLHAGPLSVSQPLLVIVDPLVSIVLAVWVFGEHFKPNPATLTVAVLSFAAMCASVVVLTRTTPATMAADTTGAAGASGTGASASSG